MNVDYKIQNMKKSWKSYAVGAAVSLIMAACSNGSTPTPAITNMPTQQAIVLAVETPTVRTMATPASTVEPTAAVTPYKLPTQIFPEPVSTVIPTFEPTPALDPTATVQPTTIPPQIPQDPTVIPPSPTEVVTTASATTVFNAPTPEPKATVIPPSISTPELAGPTPMPPTPTPPPTPIPPTPVEMYMIKLNLPRQTILNLSDRLDPELTEGAKNYIDTVAKYSEGLQTALSLNPLINNGVVSPSDISTTNRVLELSDLLAEGVFRMPDKYSVLDNGLDDKEITDLIIVDNRLLKNPNFLNSKRGPDNWPNETVRNIDGKVLSVEVATAQGMYNVVHSIEITHDSKGNANGANFDPDYFATMLNELGIYPGFHVWRLGAEYVDNVDRIRNYYPILNTPQHVHRDRIEKLSLLAALDAANLLVISFMENSSEEIEGLTSRDLGVKGGETFVAYSPLNISIVEVARNKDGSITMLDDERQMNIVNISQFVLETYGRSNRTLQENAALSFIGLTSDRFLHTLAVGNYRRGIDESPWTMAYKGLLGENVTQVGIIPAPYVFKVETITSGSASTFLEAMFTAVGMQSTYVRDFRQNLMQVEIDGTTYRARGNEVILRPFEPIRACATLHSTTRYFGDLIAANGRVQRSDYDKDTLCNDF